MRVEVALGDVVDRVTILRIKALRLRDEARIANVRAELAALEQAWGAEALPAMETLPQWARLVVVNEGLWDVEDALREHEGRGDFGRAFVELARSVYQLNDERAALKRQINLELGSRLIEEKSW